MSIYCFLFSSSSSFFFFSFTNLLIYLLLSFIFHSLGLLMFVFSQFCPLLCWFIGYVKCHFLRGPHATLLFTNLCIFMGEFFPCPLKIFSLPFPSLIFTFWYWIDSFSGEKCDIMWRIPCGVYFGVRLCASVWSEFSLANYVTSCVITSDFFPISLRRGW